MPKIEGRGAIEIVASNGSISITQEDQGETQAIYVSPHDVPMLTKHLRVAAKEAKAFKPE